MTRTQYEQLVSQVTALDRLVNRSRWVMAFAVIASFIAGAVATSGLVTITSAQSPVQRLTVRELTIVDEKGVPRVRLAAPLPDPIVLGKRVPRQGVVSGVMLYDEDGDERGGYVTESHGDVFLSLDAKQSQQAVFVGNRDGGANLSVWSGANRNDNYVSVQAVPKPLIEIKEGGTTRVFGVQP